jgi:hypothetical protein
LILSVTWATVERLPSLPSTRKAEDFLSLSYVSTRQLDEEDDCSISSGQSVIEAGTMFDHSAARFEPVSGLDRMGLEKTFPPMIFTRQSVSVWCQKRTHCDGWIGTCSKLGPLNPNLTLTAIMLLDKPFQLRKKKRQLRPGRVSQPKLASERERGIPR